MAVIVASPKPITTCQNSIAGIVTSIPPAFANIGENPISKPQTNAPPMESHDAANTLKKNLLRLLDSCANTLTTK